MLEIRIHGRGGQGAVIASQVLATAFFRNGKFTQSFSSFGGERRGAPVVAFVRVADQKIRLKCEVGSPDHVVALDASLIGEVDVAGGLKPEGIILINTDRAPEEFPFSYWYRVCTVDANSIARRNRLGPKVNTAMVGAYAKASGLIDVDFLTGAVLEVVPGNAEGNQRAVMEAYQEVKG